MFSLVEPANAPASRETKAGHSARMGSDSAVNDVFQPPEAPQEDRSAKEFKQWVCLICGWVYDEAVGRPEGGIAPGTRWEDIPDNWRCLECEVGKEDFALVKF